MIQSLFLRFDGAPPSREEINAFCDRLNEIVSSGGAISLVQIYTIARATAESNVTALADDEVDGICERVRELTGLLVEGYYGR